MCLVGCSVHQFGSSANNLGIRGCDMDLFLHIPDGDVDAENYSVSTCSSFLEWMPASILHHHILLHNRCNNYNNWDRGPSHLPAHFDGNVELLSPLIPFLSSLGHWISTSSGEARETCFLFQRISVLLQRFNAVLLHDCLPALDCADWVSYLFVIFYFQFFSSQFPRNISTEGIKTKNNNNNGTSNMTRAPNYRVHQSKNS